MDDPFNDRDVQVTGQHRRLTCKVSLRINRADASLNRPEPELLLELPLDRNLAHLLDERNHRPQTRFRGPDIAAKPQHDTNLLGLNLIEGAEPRNRKHDEGNDGRDPTLRKPRNIR